METQPINQRKCGLPGCDVHFAVNKFNTHQQFCTRSHQRKAKRMGLAGAEAPKDSANQAPEAPPVAKPEEIEVPKPKKVNLPTSGIADPAAAFIIEELKRDRDRWETAYDDERRAKRKAKEKVADLEKQIQKMEMDSALSAKNGLQGLGENPLIQGLVPFLGPVLQRIGEKAVDFALPANVAPEQMAGATSENDAFAQFKAWFLAQEADVQVSLWQTLEALKALGEQQGANNLLSTLLQIQNFNLSQYVRKSA